MEDEAVTAKAESAFLAKNGFEVIIAENGEKAVEIAVRDSSISLILMDIELGSGIDGAEAAEKILSEKNTPLVFLTSHAGKDAAAKVQKISHYGYVVKSSGNYVLLSSIKMALELYEAHEAMKDSEEKYRTIADFTYDWEHWIGPDNKFIYVSPMCEKITGYKPEEFLEDPNLIIEITYPEDKESVSCHLNEKIQEPEHFHHADYRIIAKNGEIKWISHLCRDVFSKDGKYLGRRASNRDITNRKNSEIEIQKINENLRVSEEKFRKAFTTSPDSININRLTDGMYVSINSGFTRITGYEESEVIGKTSLEIDIWNNPDDRKRLVEGLKKDGQVINLEANFKMKSGEVRFAVMSAAVIELDGVAHILSITRDMSDKKRDELEIQKKNEELSAINEELTSTVEELEATNEELAASFEEIEATNENLIKTNEELFKSKNDLESSEFRFRSIIENTEAGYFFIGKNGTIRDVNDSWVKMYKYSSREEIIGQHFTLIQKLDDIEKSVKVVEEIMLGNSAFMKGEFSRKCKDDSTGYHTFSARPVVLAGNVIGIEGFIIDTTESKLAEQVLKENQQIYRSMVENSPMGMHFYEINEKGDLIFTASNPAAVKLLGIDHTQFIGKKIIDAFPDLENTEVPQKYKESAVNGTSWSTQQINYNDGIIIGAFEVYSYQTSPGKMVAVFFDISEKKRAEEEIKEKSELLSAFIKNSPIYTFIKEVSPEQSRVLFASENFIDMIGISSSDMIGRTMYELFPAEFAKKMTADDWDVVSKGEVLKFDEDLNGHNYTTIKSPILAGSKKLLAGYTIDVTDRNKAEENQKKLERQVQQAQKLESLGVLAGGIAHDFNNIFMAVLGHAELAKEDIPLGAPGRENLSEIITASHRASELSRQMLAYAGKASFALEKVDVSSVIDEMAHLLKTSISKKALLEINFDEALPLIQADPSQIRQIIMNLIINASDAIGDNNGFINVSAGKIYCDQNAISRMKLLNDIEPGNYVYLEVRDTGSGMDSETINKIFDPFFTTKFTGRGLGLAAVIGIVRAHQGAIMVKSEVGKGTEFKLYFPAIEFSNLKKESSSETVDTEWTGKGTILLVDDEESLRMVGEKMIQKFGFKVYTAVDGLDAIEKFKKFYSEIDLVMLDLTMPKLDGIGTLPELVKIKSDIPVVMVSGFSFEDVSSRVGSKGLADVLQKPYNLNQLKKLLKKFFP